MIMDAFQDTSWLQADGWQHISGLVHGFSNRVCDREIALKKLKADDLRLHTLKQVHGDRIVIITQLSSPAERPEADGFFSSEPGTLLGIATADCVPVLMVDPRKGVAAALHAGWRGTLKGIAQRAVELLRSQWNVVAQDLYVALGPSIGGCCYEVGPEVGKEIVARWHIRSASAWRPVKGKGFLDLREVNTIQIMESGVPRENINLTGPCTFCNSAFASYRREGARAGRQLSVIGWRKI
jgi:YfiH family protein